MSFLYPDLVMHLLMFLLFLLPAGNTTNDIPRFQIVADGFYRGGQPNEAGFEFLKNQGIKTIINLRSENDEEPVVRKLGFNYVHIPMDITVWSKIRDKAIRRYFEVMNDPANYPVFIHCRRGADRTGALVGFYRIAVQGWDGKKAHSEARDIGMRWWYLGLKQQLFNFKKSSTTLNLKSVPAKAASPQ